LTTLVSAQETTAKILIPKTLAERLERRIETSEFKSISDYAVSVLSQIIQQLDYTENGKGKNDCVS